MSSRKDLEQAQTRTKAQKPQPNQMTLRTLPRGIHTLPRCIRHFNMLKMIHAHRKGVSLLTGSVRKVETDPQNRSFPTPISISHIEDNGQLGFMKSDHTNLHTTFSYINILILPFQRTKNIQKNPS